jgi:hypothetical protein
MASGAGYNIKPVMGLSIHYSGRFNPSASLKEMIEEVTDIARIYRWKYTIYETHFPKAEPDGTYNDKVYGITVSPPECEPVFLSFLSNMRMSSVFHLKSTRIY